MRPEVMAVTEATVETVETVETVDCLAHSEVMAVLAVPPTWLENPRALKPYYPNTASTRSYT